MKEDKLKYSEFLAKKIETNIRRYVYEKKDIKFNCILPESIESSVYVDSLTSRIIMSIRMSILQRQCGYDIIEHEFPAPTFMDWLKKKKRTLEITVKGFDVITDQPFTPTSQRHVEIEIYDDRT